IKTAMLNGQPRHSFAHFGTIAVLIARPFALAIAKQQRAQWSVGTSYRPGKDRPRRSSLLQLAPKINPGRRLGDHFMPLRFAPDFKRNRVGSTQRRQPFAGEASRRSDTAGIGRPVQ